MTRTLLKQCRFTLACAIIAPVIVLMGAGALLIFLAEPLARLAGWLLEGAE